MWIWISKACLVQFLGGPTFGLNVKKFKCECELVRLVWCNSQGGQLLDLMRNSWYDGLLNFQLGKKIPNNSLFQSFSFDAKRPKVFCSHWNKVGIHKQWLLSFLYDFFHSCFLFMFSNLLQLVSFLENTLYFL